MLLSALVMTWPLQSASTVFLSAVPLLEKFFFKRIATLFRCVYVQGVLFQQTLASQGLFHSVRSLR